MAEFLCAHCPKVFAKIGARNFHVKDCHPHDEEQKRCLLCAKLFASISTRVRHEELGCPKERAIVWVPPQAVNKDRVNHRHVMQRNEVSATSSQLLELFKTYLINGSASTFMLSRGKQKLEPSSVESYVSHFRVFLGFFESADTDRDVVDCFIRVKTIKDYLQHLQSSDYCQKTILNRLLALERFCGFIEEKIDLLAAHGLTSRKKTKQTEVLIGETLDWIGAQLKVLRPIATKETLVRNSRETYEQEGRWITPVDLFNKEKELRPHVDELIQQIIDHPTQRPSKSDLQSIQRFVLFLLVIRRPPMRAQNFDLTILKQVENPKEAKHNAVVIEDDKVVLQYSKFKTQSTYGFTKFYLSDFLAAYIRQFVTHVRPWFFSNQDEVPLYGSSLFLNQVGSRLQNVGGYFMDTMEKYFDKRIDISTIRKVMETAVSECSSMDSAEKDNLSKAMLHDPDTAQRYYVSKDSKSESNTINMQWDRLYQSITNSEVEIPPVISVVKHNIPSSLDLIPTSNLHHVVPMPTGIPPLISETSSVCTSPEQEDSARSLASTIARQFVIPSKSTPFKSSLSGVPAFTRRTGDWYCNTCGYDNFAYRPKCKHCGEHKLKRKATIEIESPPAKKLKSDIVSVLETGTNKNNEKIYKVLSTSKGVTWVREKHVPEEFL